MNLREKKIKMSLMGTMVAHLALLILMPSFILPAMLITDCRDEPGTYHSADLGKTKARHQNQLQDLAAYVCSLVSVGCLPGIVSYTLTRWWLKRPISAHW
jgi:hypothetical protein